MPQDPNVGVGTATFIENEVGEVLFMYRIGSHAATCYSIPGGWLDAEDENSILGSLREDGEEVGIHPINNEQLFWTCEWSEELKKRVITLYHRGYWHSLWKPPRIMELTKCSKLLWCNPRTPPTPLFPGLAEALKKQYG